MNIDEYLTRAVELQASDVHITLGVPAIIRRNGKLVPLNDKTLKKEDCIKLVTQILSERELKVLNEKGEVDCAYSLAATGARFRVNAFKQRSVYGAVLRVVNDRPPTFEELKSPPIFAQLAKKQRGLILVTGPTGSGKSTTLAAMINFMNHNLNRHIITIEDPIEYLHKHGTCIINQRQIGKDSLSFSNSLRAALRQDPDVILVGEMRDLETISVALTAAETGHLVLSTLHTIGAAKTIDRIVDIFPPSQQNQVKTQLSTILQGVISQQIIPTADKKSRVAAFEIMITNNALANLIREGKTHQMQNIIATSSAEHMTTMDGSLLELYRKRVIDKTNLFKYAVDAEYIKLEVDKIK
ncbi:MAG: type IV pilus twitching motility protein PilT [Clostridiales bacterium]|jgi:twitching motility protein PilT|nr:type IV pilus twitching motility protein PilT [Clostridiales bacterium]